MTTQKEKVCSSGQHIRLDGKEPKCNCAKKMTNQQTKELKEKIRKIITYNSDDGTSGYLLNEEQIDQFLALIKEERWAILGKMETDLRLWRPIFYRDKVTEEDMKELRKIIQEITKEKEVKMKKKRKCCEVHSNRCGRVSGDDIVWRCCSGCSTPLRSQANRVGFLKIPTKFSKSKLAIEAYDEGYYMARNMKPTKSEVKIKYRGYVIRVIPSTQIIMAIPSTAICVYYPIGENESNKEAVGQVKIMIDELLEKGRK